MNRFDEMGALDVSHEIERFAPDVPMAEARTPPKSWYVRPEFLELERERVFRRTWQYACPLDRVRECGSYARFDILGESYLIVRDERGELRALANVCRHHASELAACDGRAKELVCPYHGWTYALDGKLLRAPQMGAMRDFSRESFALPSIPVATLGPLVFVHLGTPSRSPAEEYEGLPARLEAFGTTEVTCVSRRSYPMGCNWKVFVDNYLDGGYHIAHLHHGLASQLSLDAYRTQCFERHSIQSCVADPGATFEGADFRERIGKGALYAWLYPNFMINRYGPILDINYVRPIGVDRCEVVFDYWFEETEGEEAQRFIEASLIASDRVQQEDVGISESVQRGLGSSTYDQGRYAALEIGMHHFHRLLARDLRS